MQTFTAPDPLNGETLRAELEAAGVTVGAERPTLVADELTLDVAEADRAAVQSVLDAHTGAPSPWDANREQIRTQVRDHFADLRTLAASSGALTNTQRDQALRVLARGQIRVIRLALDLYDGTD